MREIHSEQVACLARATGAESPLFPCQKCVLEHLGVSRPTRPPSGSEPPEFVQHSNNSTDMGVGGVEEVSRIVLVGTKWVSSVQ